MYKVVLIDDESVIVEGLNRVIPWEDYDCKVVGTAGSVAQGTKVINEENPDVLFTDIRMGDGDGLTMLAGLRSEHPNMQVTVLTGYREFNYAQQAIRLGVTRFLLKPSKMEELLEALQAMTDTLKNLKDLTPEETKQEEDKEEYVTSFLVREAIDYINENYAEKISLSDVADACYVSQWHLSKLLSKNTGQNFYEILNTARVESAKLLLEDPSLLIGEISDMVGYSDAPHFSRVFKKFEGVSPNEYRDSVLR